jgi:histidine kinase
MLNYNKAKYQLLKELKKNKVLLLQDKKSNQKTIVKLSNNLNDEFKHLSLLSTVNNTPKVIERDSGVLYLEYIDHAISIREFVESNQKIELDQFYTIAIAVLKILEKIHSLGIIHKDINSDNILYNPKTQEAFIIDFESSSLIKTSIDINSSIEDIEANIHFISPEQTGRVNRAVDFRSDLYSIGVLFYYLTTRRVPFEADDMIGIIHQHISKVPISPTTINTNIPPILSSLILKLLNKEPEDRYQSIFGVIEDINSIKDAQTDFQLALKDFNTKLLIKHTHYGRQKIIKDLQNIFKSTINQENRLVTIGGFSGTGKSSVVYELHKILSENFGFYGESKFEQLNSPIPYYGLMSILNDYFRGILKLDKEEIKKTKNKLLAILGDESYLLTSKIKSLELLLGKQESMESSSHIEEEAKFKRSFLQLIKFISASGKPLLFFIDDLQWADSGTIDFIQLIVSDKTIKNILIINAYRDNEVDNNHIYMQMLSRLKKSTPIDEFIIENLKIEDIKELVTDTFYRDDEELISFIYEMSRGNPFFINQMIELFNNQKLFIFNSVLKRFDYDLDVLLNIGLSTDSLDIATKNIEMLDANSIEILKLASAIGNKFTLDILTTISKNGDIEESLAKAREKYFLIKIGEIYKFSHDRIQQAMYSLIDKNDRVIIHKNIAIELEKNRDSIQFFTNIDLEIASHYNKALEILNTEQKIAVSILNLKVAKDIKKALAYAEAIKYLDAGLKVLNKENKELHWEYLFLKMETLYNAFKIDEMYSVIPTLETLVDSDEKLADLTNYVMKYHYLLNNHTEALKSGVKTIEKLGIKIPLKASKLNVAKEFLTFKYYMGRKDYKTIVDLPAMSDKRKLLISKVLFDLSPISFMVSSDLFGTYSLILANISLKYGNSKYSPIGYMLVSLMIGGGFKQFTTAYEFGEIAIKVSEKYPDLDCYSRVNFLFGCFLIHGIKPYKEYLPYKELSNKGFIVVGNSLFKNYNDFFTRVQNILFNNDSLTQIKKENLDIFDLYNNSQEMDLIKFQSYIVSFIGKLQGESPSSLKENYDYDEMEYNHYLEEQHNTSIKSMAYTFKALEWYLFDDYDKAFVFIKKGLRNIDDQLGLMVDHLFRLLYNLIVLEIKDVSLFERGVYSLNKFLLKRYADNAPFNFNLYYYLFLGQEFAKKDKFKSANKYFKLALASAFEGGSLLHIAFTYELIGKFWIQIDEISSKTYLLSAYKYYNKYKAFKKADDLAEKYSLQIEPKDKTQILTTGRFHQNIDFETALKATRVLSQEIKIETILQRMSQIIVENIGADRGFILLKKNKELFIISAIDNDKVNTNQNINVQEEITICKAIINYVLTTSEQVVVEDAFVDKKYINKEFLKYHKTRSILAMPMIKNKEIKGILYCENTLMNSAFSKNTVDLVSIVLSQLMVSLDNAFIYEHMEKLVEDRTQELANVIHDLEESQDALRELASIDPLTKLYNRRYFSDISSSILDLAKRNKTDTSIIMLDIDHFKHVNDTYGHQVGDEALRELSFILQEQSRRSDIICRWGGEEFVILLANTNGNGAFTISEKIRTVVEDLRIELEANQELKFTISLGVSQVHETDVNIEASINRADKALYEAKQGGRNKVCRN